MNVNLVDDKFKFFGWNVIVINGYFFEEIGNVVDEVKKVIGKLIVIIVKIVKGKGVLFMENNVVWYGIVLNVE